MLQIVSRFSRGSVELNTSKQEVFNNLNVPKLLPKALYNYSKKQQLCIKTSKGSVIYNFIEQLWTEENIFV